MTGNDKVSYMQPIEIIVSHLLTNKEKQILKDRVIKFLDSQLITAHMRYLEPYALKNERYEEIKQEENRTLKGK
jgi:Leu/Phe-tRNA-protein transferase